MGSFGLFLVGVPLPMVVLPGGGGDPLPLLVAGLLLPAFYEDFKLVVEDVFILVGFLVDIEEALFLGWGRVTS